MTLNSLVSLVHKRAACAVVLALTASLSVASVGCGKQPEPPKKPAKTAAAKPKPKPKPKPDKPIELVKSAPEPTYAEPTAEQQSLVEQATDSLDAGNVDAAMAAFELIAKSEPLSGVKATAIIALADLHLQRGAPDTSVALLEALDAKAPPTPELAFVMGRAYKTAGKLDKAIKAYKRSVELRPILLHAYVEIGGLYAEVGDQKKSTEALLEYERKVYKYATLLEAKDTHPSDKFKIIEAFSLLPDDRVAQSLVDALDDDYRIIRLASAEALGDIGISSAIKPLKAAQAAAVEQGDAEMATMAQQAIDKITANPSDGVTVDSAPDKDKGVGPTFVKPEGKDKAKPEAKDDAAKPKTPKADEAKDAPK